MKPQDPEPPGARRDPTSLAHAAGPAAWLVHRAARRAPAPLAARLEEEWLADLATRASSVARLRFALGCCWAIGIIASEHCVAAVAVASPASGARLALPRLGNTDLLPRNSLTVVAVIAFHVAAFYALLAGLGVPVTQLIPGTFQVHLLPDPRPAAPPPSLPHPVIADTVLKVPPPEVLPAGYPDDPDPVAAQSATDPPLTSTPAPPGQTRARLAGGPGAGFPMTDDFYPSAARRLEEQGIATINVCVDASGRLTSAPTTVRSSGYPRLDEGALQLARAGSGHYRPSSEDGHPINSCYAFRVRFQLRH
jgi:protein TonB